MDNTISSSETSISSRKVEHGTMLMFLFVMMGMGTLFPYNSLISSVEYFTTLHPDPKDDIISQIAATILLGLLLTTILLTVVIGSSSNKPFQRFSIRKTQNRIVIGFSLEAIVFVILVFLPNPSILACNLIAFFVGMGDAIAQSGLYELAASVDPRYTAGVTFGSALAGFGVSLLKLITKGIFSNNLRLDAGSFFTCNIFLVLGCIAALFRTLSILRWDELAPAHSHSHQMGGTLQETSVSNNDEEDDIPDLDQTPPLPSRNSGYSPTVFYCQTISMIWKPILAVFLNFFITLALFPGPMTAIVSTATKGSLSFGTWLPIVLITTFNFCDCLGRFVLSEFRPLSSDTNSGDPSDEMEESQPLPSSSKTIPQKLLYQIHVPNDELSNENGPNPNYRIHLPNFNCMVLYPSFLRVIFFPIFFFCINAERFSFFLFSQDLGRLFIVILFGLSNGFVATACFMAGPTFVPKSISNYEAHRDAASLLLLLFCFSGLTLGGYFALVVDRFFRVTS